MNRQDITNRLANVARLREVAERVERSGLGNGHVPGLHPDAVIAAQGTEAELRKAIAEADMDPYVRARVLVALDNIITAAAAAARGRILRDACDLIGDENGGIRLEAPGGRPPLFLRDVVDSSEETRTFITHEIRSHDDQIIRESKRIADALADAPPRPNPTADPSE